MRSEKRRLPLSLSLPLSLPLYLSLSRARAIPASRPSFDPAISRGKIHRRMKEGSVIRFGKLQIWPSVFNEVLFSCYIIVCLSKT